MKKQLEGQQVKNQLVEYIPDGVADEVIDKIADRVADEITVESKNTSEKCVCMYEYVCMYMHTRQIT